MKKFRISVSNVLMLLLVSSVLFAWLVDRRGMKVRHQILESTFERKLNLAGFANRMHGLRMFLHRPEGIEADISVLPVDDIRSHYLVEVIRTWNILESDQEKRLTQLDYCGVLLGMSDCSDFNDFYSKAVKYGILPSDTDCGLPPEFSNFVEDSINHSKWTVEKLGKKTARKQRKPNGDRSSFKE